MNISLQYNGALACLVALLLGTGAIPSGVTAAGLPPDSSGMQDDDSRARLVVAVAAGHEIAAEAFFMRYGEYLLQTGQQDSFALRRHFLDYLIDTKLVASDALRNGIEQDGAYRSRLDAIQRKLLVDFYANVTVLDSLTVSEADLRELFVRMNTKLKARHLYARTLEEATLLRRRLERGERFASLAREVFDDSVLAQNGGSVGHFTFDEMDPAFEDAAFRLQVGEISEPVRTALGYSIIQLEDRIEQPMLTETDYALKKGKLRTFVLQRKRRQALSELSHRIAENMRIAFDERNLGQLYDQIRGVSLMPDGEAADSWLSADLVSFDSALGTEAWSVAEFRAEAAFTSEDQRSAVVSLEHLRMFIAGLLVREEMVRRAREMKLDGRPAYREGLEQAMELWLYRRAADKQGSDEGFRNFVAGLRDEYEVTAHLEILKRLASPTALLEAAKTPVDSIQ